MDGLSVKVYNTNAFDVKINVVDILVKFIELQTFHMLVETFHSLELTLAESFDYCVILLGLTFLESSDKV